jgi:hypothetical protein
MLVFGVGCFNFGVNLNVAGSINASKYAALLEKSLYEIDYIERNSVVIDYDNSLEFSIRKDASIELLGDGGGFPLPPFFKLQFSISIPKHVQEEIGKEMGTAFNIQKSIHITIIDTFHGSITFVQHESDSVSDASWSVVLIRKYFEKHFKSDLVYFENIGPSPFHVDFSIAAATDFEQISELDENGFSATTIPRRGYDHVHFLYLNTKYKTDKKALEELIQHLDHEIDFFYLVNKFRIIKMREWDEIDLLYNKLIESTSKYDWFSRIKLTFAPDGRMTNQLLHKLTSFEIMDFDFTTTLEADFDSTYSKGTPTYLQKIIEKEYRRRTESYPTKQVIYFLEFHEKRLLQVWQTSLLAISALVGALIGSIVTALTSSGH